LAQPEFHPPTRAEAIRKLMERGRRGGGEDDEAEDLIDRRVDVPAGHHQPMLLP